MVPEVAHCSWCSHESAAVCQPGWPAEVLAVGAECVCSCHPRACLSTATKFCSYNGIQPVAEERGVQLAPPFWAFVLCDSSGTALLTHDEQMDIIEDVAVLLEPPEPGLWFWQGDFVNTRNSLEPDLEERGRWGRATVRDLRDATEPTDFGEMDGENR